MPDVLSTLRIVLGFLDLGIIRFFLRDPFGDSNFEQLTGSKNMYLCQEERPIYGGFAFASKLIGVIVVACKSLEVELHAVILQNKLCCIYGVPVKLQI